MQYCEYSKVDPVRKIRNFINPVCLKDSLTHKSKSTTSTSVANVYDKVPWTEHKRRDAKNSGMNDEEQGVKMFRIF